jgi:hypothetical protein
MDEERRLRDALKAFESACQDLIEASREDPSAIDPHLAAAEARLAEARARLDALRKRQAPS